MVPEKVEEHTPTKNLKKNMKVNGKITVSMVLAKCNIKKLVNIMVSGKMEEDMEKVYSTI